MNNFKKVIALSVMVIMVISIAPVGVFAEDVPEVYWDKDVIEFNVDSEESADTLLDSVAPIDLSFKYESEATANLSFSGDVKIADAEVGALEHAKAIKLPPRAGTDPEPTNVVFSFDGAAYSDNIQFKFDMLFGEQTEGLNIIFYNENGESTDIEFTNTSFFVYPNGNTSNKIQHGIRDAKVNVWNEVVVALDMVKEEMRLTIGGTKIVDADRSNTDIFTGLRGTLEKIEFVRNSNLTSQKEDVDKYVWLDNFSICSHKEKPVFVDAEGNPAPTTGILPTRELNVKLDILALYDGSVIDDSHNPFVVKKVSDDSTINVSKVTPVGEDHCQWKLFLDSKLEDGTAYKLVAENIKDTAGKTATAEYTFTTTPPPANFGIYKLGYLDGTTPKYEFNNGDTIKANLVVANTSNAAEDVTGAVVIYKKTPNGIEMIGITADHENIAGNGGTADFTSNLSVTITDGDTSNTEGYIAKTFAWKGDLTTQTGAKFIPFATASYKENKEN